MASKSDTGDGLTPGELDELRELADRDDALGAIAEAWLEAEEDSEEVSAP